MASRTQPAADVRETASFEVPGLFEDDGKTPRQVELFKPTEVQLKTLGRLGEAATKGGGGWKTVSLTDQMLASLFVEQSDWDDFEVAMVTAAVGDEEYVDFARTVIRHWIPEAAEEAPTNGPRSTKRPARRAR